MHFPFLLATGLAFLSSSLSVSASTSSPSRLFETRSPKTCAPVTSEYLYQITADGVSKFGFLNHYSYIRLVSSEIVFSFATNIHAKGWEESDQLAWNLVKQDHDNFQIQSADGSKCASVRGKDQKVGLAACDTSASIFEITCSSCGTSSCGDPFANKCTIRSRKEEGQCLARVGKLIMTKKCDEKDKTQKWGFNLA
ncbi:hypothetical protein JCM3765_006332 [Sporobolomyces pararoseus]